MADEPIKIQVDFPPEESTEDGFDVEVEPLGTAELDKIWQELVNNDGQVATKQEDSPADSTAPVVEEPTAEVGEVTTEGTVSEAAPTDFEKRMAELEAQGLASLEAQKAVPAPEPDLGNKSADSVTAPARTGEAISPESAPPVHPDFLDVSQAKLPRYIQVGDVLIDSREALENLTPEARALFLAAWQVKQQEAKAEPVERQIAEVPRETSHGTLDETVKKLSERQDALERMNRHYEAERAVARLDPEIIKINANPPGSTQPHEFWSYLDSLSPGKRYMVENGPPEVTAEVIGYWRETVKAKAIAAANEEKAKVKTRTDNLHSQTAVASNNAPPTRNIKNMTHEQEQDIWNRLPERQKQAWWESQKARLG